MTQWLEALGSWDWLILGAILLIAEVVLTSGYVIWVAIAAIIVGILAIFPSIGWEWQFFAFAILTLISGAIGRAIMRKVGTGKIVSPLNNPGNRLVGTALVVSDPLRNGVGKVKSADGYWLAKGPDTEIGEQVQVTGVEGTYLLVQPLTT